MVREEEGARRRAGGGGVALRASRGDGKSRRERGSAMPPRSYARTRDLLAPRLCDRGGDYTLSSSIEPPAIVIRRDRVVAIAGDRRQEGRLRFAYTTFLARFLRAVVFL